MKNKISEILKNTFVGFLSVGSIVIMLILIQVFVNWITPITSILVAILVGVILLYGLYRIGKSIRDNYDDNKKYLKRHNNGFNEETPLSYAKKHGHWPSDYYPWNKDVPWNKENEKEDEN